MQRGTTRPRSIHDTGDKERPKYKLKQSAANISHLPVPSMGHQITNGSNSNGAAGPSNNGHSSVAESYNVKTGGELMYEDDGDWGVYQDLANEADEAEDQRLSDGQTGRRPLKGSAAAKRMPVNREEVVRLILQGLKDMGYGSVQLSASGSPQLILQSISRCSRGRIWISICLSISHRF
jgi:hypothetical protein